MTSSAVSCSGRSNTRLLFLQRAGCFAMAGRALQLRTIAYDAKRCKLRHAGRKLVRDGKRCSASSFVRPQGFPFGRLNLALSKINTHQEV